MPRKQSSPKQSSNASQVLNSLRYTYRQKGEPIVGPWRPGDRFVRVARRVLKGLAGSTMSNDETKGQGRKARKKR